jgi:hypothetical protein
MPLPLLAAEQVPRYASRRLQSNVPWRARLKNGRKRRGRPCGIGRRRGARTCRSRAERTAMSWADRTASPLILSIRVQPDVADESARNSCGGPGRF